MLRIYHAPGTRSVRPIWLCYELGIEVDVVTVPFTPEYLRSDEWRLISPAGKIPILQDGDLTMFESGAMMDYILDRYGNGRLRPVAGTPEFALHQQWSWFAESTLSRPLGMGRIVRSSQEDIPKIATEKVEDCLHTVESALEGKDFLVGEFSSADIMLGYSLELTRRFEILDDRFPNTLAYLERLISRDACVRTLKLS